MTMAFTCESCRRRSWSAAHVSLLGRQLCDRCDAQVTGAAAGLISSDGDVGTAIATGGWFASMRERRRQRRRDRD